MLKDQTHLPSQTEMPSSKSSKAYRDTSTVRVEREPPPPIPIIRNGIAPPIVSMEEWCDQNFQHLTDVFSTLQDINKRTARLVFDEQTCPFAQFCAIAYSNSHKYRRNQSEDY